MPILFLIFCNSYIIYIQDQRYVFAASARLKRACSSAFVQTGEEELAHQPAPSLALATDHGAHIVSAVMKSKDAQKYALLPATLQLYLRILFSHRRQSK